MADQRSSKKHRVVKNPETFRERALKASENEGKPAKRSRVTGPIGKVLGAIFRPIGKAGRWLGKFRVFRWIGRVLAPRYLRSSFAELKQVTWPSWRESRRLTYAVLIFAIIFGVSIAGVDWVLDKAFRAILLK